MSVVFDVALKLFNYARMSDLLLCSYSLYQPGYLAGLQPVLFIPNCKIAKFYITN